MTSRYAFGTNRAQLLDVLARIWSTEFATAESPRELRAERAATRSALAIIAGILLSGPIAPLLVSAVHPQPRWDGAERFVAAYHPVQLLPYLGGFVLLAGCIALIASLYRLVPRRRRARARFSVGMAAVFAALILFNYVAQAILVPSFVADYRAEHDGLIAALSMANPRSYAWVIEMWGYAALGIAMWAAAAAFRTARIERLAAATYIANGVLSITAAIVTVFWPAWMLTLPGLIAYVTWNLLMIVMAGLTIAVMRYRAGAL